LQPLSYICINPTSSLSLTAKSYRETSCSRSPQKAKIPLVVQQLDLAQSFNDMLVFPSSTSAGSTRNTLPSRSRRQFSAPHHHLLPSLPCPHAIPNPLPPRAARINPNPPHRPYGAAGCSAPAPAPPHTSCTARAAGRGSPTRMGALIHPARVPIGRRLQYLQHDLGAPLPQPVCFYSRRSRSIPSSPNTTNPDGTYADVRLPLRTPEAVLISSNHLARTTT